MEALKFGNGVWATKTGSSMAYNDHSGNYKPLPFNVVRNSTATRVNKEGLIEVVGRDKLRIDYTDTDKGVALLENSSTNLYTYSEDFSDSSWSKSNIDLLTLTSDIAPNGTSNSVYNFKGDDSNLFTNTQSANVEYTISFYVKSNLNGKDNFKLRLGGGFSEFTATNEWVKYSYKATPTSQVFGISSNGIDSDVLIWGAQLEQGNVSSYIPTSGSAVTRAADVANGSGNSEVFNDSEGVLFANIASLKGGNTDRQITINDGTTNDRLSIALLSNGTQINFVVVDGGVVTLNASRTISTILLGTKMLISYKVNNFKVYVNGFLIVTDTSGNTPSGLKALSFDRGDGVDDFYGKIKQIGCYDAILTDAELEKLTSYNSLSELVTELNLNTL